MATFEKLRISLSREPEGELLGLAGGDAPHRTRREFLEHAFSEPRSFLHLATGRRFDFVPIEIDGDFVGGIFRRASPVALHNSELEQYEAENYEGSVFLLSLRKDQTAWMQYNRRLGATRIILESFFGHLLRRTEVSDWNVFIRHFEDGLEYFETIRSRRAEIAEISFTFIPPNALSADDEVYKFVKKIQLQARPETQKHTYRAAPGQMNPDTDYLNASARVAMEGGGDAEVRDKKRRILYGKSKGKVTKEVPDDDLPTPAHKPFMKRVRAWLFGDEAE